MFVDKSEAPPPTKKAIDDHFHKPNCYRREACAVPEMIVKIQPTPS